VECFGGQHFLVAGGGGAAKTGIPNAIETFEITHLNSHRCEVEGLNRTATDDLVQDANEAIMNGAVSKFNLRARSVFYATGMNNQCTVFEVYKEPNKIAKLVGCVNVCDSSAGYQTAVGWTHDNSLIVTADSTGCVSAWSFPQLEKKFSLKVHSSEIEWMSISPLGFTAVTCGRDGSMCEVNLDKGELANDLFWTADELQMKAYRCRACCYAPVNHDRSKMKLYSVHISKVMKNKQKAHMFLVKWDSRLIPERKAVLNSTDTPSCLAASIDGNFLGIGSLEGHVSIYISFSLRCVKRVENAHSSFITGLVFAPVTFLDKSAESSKREIMQSRLFSDFDAVLLTISIDKQVNCITLPLRTTISVGMALILCFAVILLIGVGIAFGSVLEI